MCSVKCTKNTFATQTFYSDMHHFVELNSWKYFDKMRLSTWPFVWQWTFYSGNIFYILLYLMGVLGWQLLYTLTLDGNISALCNSVDSFHLILCLMKMRALWKLFHSDTFHSTCANGRKVKHTKSCVVILLIPNTIMFLLLIALASSASICPIWFKLSNIEGAHAPCQAKL